MDHQYGIAVTNKFSFLIDDEEDPLEILKQREEEAKNLKKDDKKTKTKSGKKTATADIKPKQPEPPVAKKEEKPAQLPRTNERGGGRGGRGRELRENDGSRPPRRQAPRENRESLKGDENVPPEFRDRGDGSNRRERGEGGFERGRGRGGGRGRGRARGGPRPESGRGGFGGAGERRREFDRHSGTDKTGVKPVDKRDGSGAHNWGSYKDDVEEQAQPQTSADESGEWVAPQVEQTENAEPTESGEAVAPKEDDDNKEMTLDEWKALQDQKRMRSSFNIRKAGEGVDNAQWKKGIAYTKKKEEEDDEEEDSEDEDEDEDRHGHRKQIVTDIRITFADNPRRGGRGGRGGRGRGGPRGEGRGGPRGGGPGRGGFGGPGERAPRGTRESAAPRMDDETDFPRLVKSEA